MSDIDIAAVDSLKVLDLNRPIREADNSGIGEASITLSARSRIEVGRVTTERFLFATIFCYPTAWHGPLQLGTAALSSS